MRRVYGELSRRDFVQQPFLKRPWSGDSCVSEPASVPSSGFTKMPERISTSVVKTAAR